MKFGAFPMYVFAPMKIEPVQSPEQLRPTLGSRPAFDIGPVGRDALKTAALAANAR